jgi:Na+-driven multidrug efflux pump
MLYFQETVPINLHTLYTALWTLICAGVARGCGWQKIGVCVNLGAFYIIGILAAYLIVEKIAILVLKRCASQFCNSYAIKRVSSLF